MYCSVLWKDATREGIFIMKKVLKSKKKKKKQKTKQNKKTKNLHRIYNTEL